MTRRRGASLPQAEALRLSIHWIVNPPSPSSLVPFVLDTTRSVTHTAVRRVYSHPGLPSDIALSCLTVRSVLRRDDRRASSSCEARLCSSTIRKADRVARCESAHTHH